MATDVAARGLDVDDVDMVLQLGCRHLDSFVHRSGRTGRRGKEGKNIIFFDSSEYEFIMRLERKLRLDFKISSHVSVADGIEPEVHEHGNG